MRKALASAIVLAAACAVERAPDSSVPTWRGEVASSLDASCAKCHTGALAAGGWRATSYLDAIGCVSGAAATQPGDEHAPIVNALGSDAHAGVRGSRDLLLSWVGGGAPAFRGQVHDAGIVDPRSPAFHGTLLRARKWKPMTDANDIDACGRCHDGAAAPGATACTDCHREDGGTLACTTCHGSAGHAYPPRDPCFFPGERGGAHAAHVDGTKPLACETCHPRVDGPPTGRHGDGVIDVAFDASLAGTSAAYGDRVCAVACHDRGGARPRPSWDDTTKMSCNDCHSSPPRDHYRGACTSCHRESDATGTSLTPGPLHVNGKVDLGDGSGKCGACHGRGDDPWPTTASHPAHELPGGAAPVACASCHPVPSSLKSPGHLDGVVQVIFTGNALARDARPAWNGTTCTDVACHGARLPEPVASPAWRDASGAAKACGACHGLPPTIAHAAAQDCERSICHGAEVSRSSSGLSIATIGLHIDGIIETNH
jgi:predicted CxxxxCH...CXXCH cytochrome family protein